MKIHLALAGVMALGIGCTQHKTVETKMSLAEVPPAVRDTLTREAGGATITTVDREEKHGKTIYETDVMSGGKTWEIKVDPDGKLLSKKVEENEKEEHEHN